MRIKKGIYKDDLGLIETVSGNKKALVRLVPRIPDNFYNDQSMTLQSLRQVVKRS